MFPSFFIFFLIFKIFILRRRPHPLGNVWWSSPLVVYTPHTQNIQTTRLLPLAALPPPGRSLGLITQSEMGPLHTVHPTSNILSAHAHAKGLGTTRKVGTGGESGPPKHHTPQVLCRFRRAVFRPRETFQVEVPEAAGWGAKWHALAGTRTLLPRLSLSPEDF